MSLAEREDRHKNLLSFNEDFDLDMAEDSVLEYRATLAHKANHAFGESANTKFCFAESPRYGLLLTSATRRTFHSITGPQSA